MLRKAAGVGRSGDSGGGRAPLKATRRRARGRAHAGWLVLEAAPARGKIGRR